MNHVIMANHMISLITSSTTNFQRYEEFEFGMFKLFLSLADRQHNGQKKSVMSHEREKGQNGDYDRYIVVYPQLSKFSAISWRE